MGYFKYDIIQLIECVRDRPCLWDKTLEIYKDRIERRESWEAIFSILEEDYDEMEPEEKRLIGEQVLSKWTNLRDTFMRSLKKKIGKPKRKYIYFENLKFLLKVVDVVHVDNDTVSPDTENMTYFKLEDEEPKPPPRKEIKRNSYDDEYTTVKKPRKTSKKDSMSNSFKDIDFVECQETEKFNDPRIMNEDEAFFASLLPTVVKYNEEERLEFRIEVLALIKKIKQKRVYN